MKIVSYSAEHDPQLQRFSSSVIKPNYITLQGPFFRWQFQQAAQLVHTADNGMYLCVDDDGEIAAISLAVKTPFLVDKAEHIGAWHHEWFSRPGTRGLGSQLVDKQLSVNAVFGHAGQSLQAAIALQRLQPMAWFFLILKFEMAFLARVTAGFWPVIWVISFTAKSKNFGS